MNIREIISDFLKDQGYLNDPNVEGVIFYGSYQTNTNTDSSDIDIMIIYSDESNKEAIKGYKKYKGYDFEYFERTLSSLYKRAEYDYIHFEDTLYSSVGYAELLIDKNQKLKKLQNYVLTKYKEGLPKLEDDEKMNLAKSLHKSMERLYKMREISNPYFSIFYGITLEQIRNYYHKLNGFSNISTANVCKLYTNEKIQRAQHKNLPENKFIELYLKCVNNVEYKNILELYSYVIRDIKDSVDFYNIRIKLGNRQH